MINMKKKLVLFISVIVMLCLSGCGEKEKSVIELTEVTDIPVPAFNVKICGKEITEQEMAASKLYSYQIKTVNSQGTEKDNVYVGYQFNDVLKAAEVEGDISSAKIICADGYEMNFEGDLREDRILLAVTKDGEPFKEEPWFAPCTSKTTGDYAQNLAKVEVEGIASSVSDSGNEDNKETKDIVYPQDPVCEDKTDKIKFNAYSFKINGKAITNTDLDGLNIYRITVTTRNSKNVVSQNKYSGYVLKDVLDKLGITGTKVSVLAADGYESELTADMLSSNLTIIAIEKDKIPGENGTVWVAPCKEITSGAYAKDVVEIMVK